MKTCTLALLLALAPGAATAAEPSAPLAWEATATWEGVHVADGGLERGSRSLVHLFGSATVDTAAQGWWSGGTLHLSGYLHNGGQPSELVGDLQVTSNLEGLRRAVIYEAWVAQRVGDGRAEVLVGLHDLNATFAVVDSAAVFLNSSFGIGPDIAQAGPSLYPVTALGAHLTLTGERDALRVAVYDGIPGDPESRSGIQVELDGGDGVFAASEWARSAAAPDGRGLRKLAVGAWWHSAQVTNPVDGGSSDRNAGAWTLLDWGLTARDSLFLQAGVARPGRNLIGSYLGAGVVRADALLPGDTLGLAVAHARASSDLRDAVPGTAAAETAIEVTWRVPVGRWLVVQPDLQVVLDPGFDERLDPAWVVGVRVEASF